jgi:hypothetical protein
VAAAAAVAAAVAGSVAAGAAVAAAVAVTAAVAVAGGVAAGAQYVIQLWYSPTAMHLSCMSSSKLTVSSSFVLG